MSNLAKRFLGGFDWQNRAANRKSCGSLCVAAAKTQVPASLGDKNSSAPRPGPLEHIFMASTSSVVRGHHPNRNAIVGHPPYSMSSANASAADSANAFVAAYKQRGDISSPILIDLSSFSVNSGSSEVTGKS